MKFVSRALRQGDKATGRRHSVQLWRGSAVRPSNVPWLTEDDDAEVADIGLGPFTGHVVEYTAALAALLVAQYHLSIRREIAEAEVALVCFDGDG